MAKSSRLHSLNSCSLLVFLWGPAYSKRQSTSPGSQKGPVSQKALTHNATDATRQSLHLASALLYL